MKQEIVTVASDLDEAPRAYRRDHGEADDFSALVDAALRQFLCARGYVAAAEYRPLRLTPDERGSGQTDVSIEHDRYLYELPE